MSQAPFSPAEDVLTNALVELKRENPSLGISRIHALLLRNHPEWAVSEKRTKKILQLEGLTSNAQPADPNVSVYPQSRLVNGLDVGKWSAKVKVKMFDKRKGKGLVATSDIAEGEIVWKEDPFVVAAEWDIYDLQATGRACALCTTPFNDSPLVIPCPCSSSSSTYCSARFCNRLCLARSAKVHPLLCTGQNPGAAPLIKFIRERQWMALNALAHCISRVLLANQYDDATLRADWDVMRGFAALGMEERSKHSYYMSQNVPDRPTWKKAHQLVVQAFKESKNANDQKKLDKLLKKPLPTETDEEFFEYDSGFLRNLGKMSLNLEAHGGLYTLHSNLNHSCNPNISIRHLDQRTALSRITVIAKRPITPSEELTVTYVNPELPYKKRQEELQAWGFGRCRCDRCLEDEKNGAAEAGGEGAEDVDDLARELKAGLGVM